MPKVSVVLPTFNGQEYIKETIDSIINQTFSDWELIIVNDCSTDNTLYIINEYEKKDNRISIVNNIENEKLPNALNIGFKKAYGEYFTWTSDDNIYKKDAFETMVDYLDNNDCTFVCASMNMIDSDGRYIDKYIRYSYETMLINNCVGACFMYRRCVLDEVGEYNADCFLVEDYEYWLRVLFKYGKIHYIDKVLYLYRNHSLSLTETRRKEINMQLQKLRVKYVQEIVNGIKDNKEVLFQVYYELKNSGFVNQKVQNVFEKVVPEIKMECQAKISDHFIVYGAGNYGKMAYQKYNKKILYFVDKCEELVGNYIHEIEIISVEELRKYSDIYPVMIAVSPEKMYSCVNTLLENGIKEYYIYQE